MTACAITLPVMGISSWMEAGTGLEPCGFLDLSVGKPVLDFVDPAQRRRLSPMARGVLHCAGRLAPPGDLRVVFASRHGEAERTLALLRDLAAGVDVSPTLFSMSVHNAVPGLLSILRGNRAPSTAVAAGSETFGYGLLAAAAAWKADPESQVLYLFGEDRLPELWGPYAPQETPHAIALLIGAGGRDLALGWDPAGRGPEPDRTQSMHFLAALAGPRAGWTGPTGSWDWRLA